MIERAQQYLSGPGQGPSLMKAVIGSAGLRIAGMGFGFLVGVQLARSLGAEGYGVYGLAMSIIALLTVPTEFGLPQLLTREVAAAHVAGDWGKVRGVLRWSSRAVLGISLLLAVCVLIWLFLTGRAVDSPLATTLFSGVLMVPFVALGNLRGAALRGLQHIVKGQLPDTLIRPVVFSLFLFLFPLLFVSLSPALAMGLGALSAALSFVAGSVMLRRAMPTAALTEHSQRSSRAWWASAFPMALTEGMRVIAAHLVILLLGTMSTVAVVGIYRVASSVALSVSVPITLFNVVSAPVIARLHAQGDRVRLQRLLRWIAIGMCSSSLLLTVPFLIAGEPLLVHLFGPEFGHSNQPLLVLCASVIINAMFGASAALLNMTGHQQRVTHASAVTVALLALILPGLIHFEGVGGAAFGRLVAMFVWNLMMWRDGRRLLGLDTSVFSIFSSRAATCG